MLGMPPVALFAVGAVVVGLAGFASGYLLRQSDATDDESVIEPIDDIDGAEGFMMASGDDPGILGSYKREKQRRKALSKGMVRWHLAGSNFSEPRYIKPERKEGGNIPEVEHDGNTYLFPDNSTVPSAEEGVPVVVHRVGDAEPINLRDSWEDSIDAGSLTQYLTLRVTSKKPHKGLLDGMGLAGWDAMTVFRYGLLGIIGLAILLETVGGGLY